MNPSRLSLTSVCTLGLLFAGSCGGDAVDGSASGGSSGADDGPPLTQASPGGGLYSAGQLVTLTSDEPATIYFTTDGVIPTIGGLTTQSGPSPITNIDTTTGGVPFTLRFFGVDDDEEEESIKQAVYTYDLTPPVVAHSNPFGVTFGFLDEILLQFTTDETGFYWFELGGDGTQGSGTVIAQGPAIVGPFNDIEIPVWSLEMNNPTPGLLAYLHVQNVAGGITSVEFRIKTQNELTTAVAGNNAGIELTPNESYGFLLRPDEGEVWRFVSSTSAGTLLTLDAPITVGGDLRRMKVNADSSKLYVTAAAGVHEVDVAAQTLTASYGLPGSVGCSGIAILSDPDEAILAGDDGKFYIMDLGTGASVALLFTEPMMGEAELYQSLDELQAAIVWSGAAEFGVKILDTNPSSGGYLNALTQVISGPVPALIPQFTFNPLGTTGYTGNSEGRLTSVILNSLPPAVGSTGVNSSVNGIRLPSGGQALILSENSLPGLFLADPDTLQVTHLYNTGGTGSGLTSRDARFTTLNGMLFVVRNNDLPTAELMAIPL